MASKLAAAAALLLTATASAAATADTMTGVFDPTVRSLQVLPADAAGNTWEGPPVISLDGSDRLVVSFDMLSDDRDYLRYELRHCDALWQPDTLVDPEYLDGFNYADIDDYAYSRTPGRRYVNYRVTLPSSQMRPVASGNYLMRVYPEDDPDTTLLQVRFAVNEASAPVSVEATTFTDFDFDGTSQQLTVAVDTEHLDILDPFNDLRLVVEQDGRTDNAVTVTHPLRLTGRTAIYEHSRDLTFKGGNEYRRFETVNNRLPSMGEERVVWAEPYYHHVLYADTERASRGYTYDLGRHGRWLPRVSGLGDLDPDLDPEYVVVHFTLHHPYEPGKKIYLEGDLTSRRLDAGSEMAWDPAEQAYTKALLLKQGAYSYQYLVVDPDAPRASRTAPIEGDFSDTSHQYTVRVYYRTPGGRYDRLAGVATVNFPAP